MLWSILFFVPIVLGVFVQVALFCGVASLTGPRLLGYTPRIQPMAIAMVPPFIGATVLLLIGIIDTGITLDDARAGLAALGGIAMLVVGAAIAIRRPDGQRLGLWASLKLIAAYLATVLLLGLIPFLLEISAAHG